MDFMSAIKLSWIDAIRVFTHGGTKYNSKLSVNLLMGMYEYSYSTTPYNYNTINTFEALIVLYLFIYCSNFIF